MLGSSRRSGKASLAACALVIAVCAGCDAPADEGSETSESYVCTTVGSSWWNQSFAERTGTFHFNFYATPSAGNIDGVVGLSFGAATTWSKLAAIVRFNPDGYIDVRAGGSYRADVAYRYGAGLRYRFDVAVDMTRHTYTVIVDTGGDQVAIARDYPFRTEQAGVTRLDNIAGFTNPDTGPGTLSVCEPTISDSAPPPAACITPMAGEGFRNAAIDPSSTVQLVQFTAIAGKDAMDGVIGVSNGPADDYNDFAASIRFYTNGYVEARDADAYRADVQVPYRQAQRFEVRFIVDVPSRTYSAFVRPEGDYDFIELARGYRFRPQQAAVPKIDNVAMIVASGLGGLTRCDLQGGPHWPMASARDGTWDVHALVDGALISDGSKTIKLDGGNVPRATLAAGGKVAADAAGNVYLASLANGNLTIRAYTAAFAPRWTATRATTDSAVGDIIVNSAGHVAVSLGASDGWTAFTPTHVVRFDSYGRYLSTANLFAPSTAIGLSTNHFAVALAISGGVEVQIWTYGGALVRTRQFIGDFDITHIAIAPDDTVAFGGTVNSGTMRFDECLVEPYSGTEVYWNSYVTVLRSDLFTNFCKRLTNDIYGVSTTGTETAVSYQTWTQLQYVTVDVYSQSGGVLMSAMDAFVGSFGEPGSVWLGANGRVYLNETASLGGWAERHFPFLITIQR